jgi:hypothetical protein
VDTTHATGGSACMCVCNWRYQLHEYKQTDDAAFEYLADTSHDLFARFAALHTFLFITLLADDCIDEHQTRPIEGSSPQQ